MTITSSGTSVASANYFYYTLGTPNTVYYYNNYLPYSYFYQPKQDPLNGLTVDQIFEIYQNSQRDIKQSIQLNSAQLEIAKLEWSKRLKTKSHIENDKIKYQIVVDYMDID